MSDTTAKIRAKGLDATGVTENIADTMFHRKGTHYMAIVEFVVDETHEKAEGKRKVDLVLTQVEPAIDATLEDHLRELTRTLHFNRAIDADQPTLDGGDGINPKVSDVIRDGVRHRPHPFLPVDASNDNGICDVCGLVDSAGVHSTQDFLPDGDEEGTGNEGDPDAEPDAHDGPGEQITTTGEQWEYDAPEGQPHQAGDEPTVSEVLAAKDRANLQAVPDPFSA